jgi:hypothetical protein
MIIWHTAIGSHGKSEWRAEDPMREIITKSGNRIVDVRVVNDSTHVGWFTLAREDSDVVPRASNRVRWGYLLRDRQGCGRIVGDASLWLPEEIAAL